MKKRKILITGAAGFIGSHLTDELLKNFTVIGLDNLSNGKLENLTLASKNENFFFHQGDILDKKVCDQVTQDIDIVFHLACLGIRHSLHSPFENQRVNAEGTLNLLQSSVKNSVKKFFYISTSEVYGDIKKFPIEETDAPLPKTIYGSSKLAGENYTYSFYKSFGLNATILRIFNNYGPRSHYEGDAGEIIPRTIVQALYHQSPVIFGSGEITRDFFYVKDTARALASLVDLAPMEGEIFNIGTGVEITMKRLVETILKETGKSDVVKINYLEPRPADVSRLWVNADKFKKLTNFKADYSFEEGLKETIEYFKVLKDQKDLLKEIKIKNWIK
jgi:UDP-glucose 4-epimerase